MTAAGPVAIRAPRRLGSETVALAGLAVACLSSAALGLYLTRGTTLGADEYWFFVTDRGLDLRQLLSPHAGNLIVVVRLLYAAVFAVFGPAYIVLRVLEVLGALGAACLFFALARRRIPPLPALALTLPLLFLGATGEITLSPNGINVVYAVCLGLGALLALEAASRRADALACLLLTLSLATFSVGFAFIAAAAVAIALMPGWRARTYIVAVPLALYAIWKLFVPVDTGPGYLTAAPIQLANVRLIPWFALRSAAASAAAVTGLYRPFGHTFGPFDTLNHYHVGFVLLGLGAVAIGIQAVRGGVRRSIWPWIAFAVAFWSSIVLVLAINRFPNSARYLYAGALALLLIGAEGLRGLRWRAPYVGVLLGGAGVSLAFNIATMSEYARGLRAVAGVERAADTGMELAAGHVRASQLPAGGDLLTGLIDVGGGVEAYLQAVQRWGSPAFTLAQLRRAPEVEREVADLIEAQTLELRATPARDPGSRCLRSATGLGLAGRAPGLIVVASRSGALLLGRFADRPHYSAGMLDAGRASALAIAPDRAPDPWRLALPPGPVRVCAL